ncbi:neuritin-like protein [Hyperolius riggenbachi]|uniref:neuritin-like protein n=1 Tax=Hyperolius riggenbachi TaxID=752182 RepID=UPI0035A2BCBC
MGCMLWILIMAMILQLDLQIPVNGTSRSCDTIYKGFADCLISLGDSMATNAQKAKVTEDFDDIKELDFICKSWDDFHKCASNVLINCPEDAAAIWEALRQESRKIQYKGNLHELCTSRNQRLNIIGASDTAETNKEAQQGLACMPKHSLLPFVVTGLLLWIIAKQV